MSDPVPPSAPTGRRGSTLVAAGILLSRIAGFIRERAFGHFFGTSATAGAFKTAFRIPNLLQNLLGEGVLSASFIPVYSRLLDDGDEEEAGRVAGAVAGLLALVTGVLVIVGVVFAEPLVQLITLGRFDPEIEALTVRLMRIIAPGTGVLVLSAWCLGVLNSHRQFFLSYVAPVLWNFAQITGLIFGAAVLVGTLGPSDSPARVDLVTILTWSTFLGALLQLAVQVPGVRRAEPHLKLSLRRDLPGVQTTFRRLGPVIAGRGVVQIGALLDLTLAALLSQGESAIAALAAAQTIYILPVSLFGMSVAAAELPELSRTNSSDIVALTARLQQGSRRIAFFVLPSALAFIVIGDLLVGGLYRSGQFGRLEEIQVWLVLAGFSIGLLATTATRLLQSVFYGIGDVRTPAWVAAIRIAAGTTAALLLMFPLDRFGVSVTDGLSIVSGAELAGGTDVVRLGVVGLSLGSALAGWVEFQVLRSRLSARLGDGVALGGGILPELAMPLLAAVIVGLLSRVVFGAMPRLAGAPLAVIFTGGAYVVVAARSAVPEARELFESVVRRLDR